MRYNRGVSHEDLIAELRESEERFRTICENAPVMIDEFDHDGRCILWNQECVKQLGYTFDELRDVEDALALFYPDPGERARAIENIREADGKFREYRVQAKNGETRIQMWADFRLPDGANISVGYDVTESRAIDERLRQSQKVEALGQLTRGIAHDLNNLLTVVLGNADLLADEAHALGEEAGASVQEIVDAATRGAGLIRKLLAFSRQKIVETGQLDLAQVVKDHVDTMARLLPENILVELHAPTPFPPANADADAVEQVLLNVVTNARDAMPHGGRLTFTLQEHTLDDETARLHGCAPGPYLAVVVQDDGRGMDEATLRRVLEPFFSTKAGAGSGLGASMAYGLMRQHGGTMLVESTPGEGTRVSLLFAPADEAEPPPPTRTSQRARLLLVEDEASILRVTATVLGAAGYEVATATDGQRALALLEAGPAVDLVVCDVVMPVMGGAALYRLAHERLAAPPPFLFVTGYAADEEMGEELHDLPVMRKPYRIDALVAEIGRLLQTAGAAKA